MNKKLVIGKPNSQKIISARTAKRRREAKILHAKGYSIRQIQKKLGYKNVGGVQYLLNSR